MQNLYSAATGQKGEEKQAETKDSKLIVSILDKVIGGSFFMIFFGLPLFFTTLTFQGVFFEKQIYFYFWLLLALVCWAARGVIEGEMKIRRTPLDIFIIGFWAVYLIATIFSVDRWHSFWGSFGDPSRGLMSITALAVAYFVIVSNFNEKRLRLIFLAILLSGLLLALWTTLSVLGIHIFSGDFSKKIPVSLFGSVTGLVLYLSALIPLAATAIFKIAENQEMNKAIKKIFLAGIFAELILSFFLMLALYNFVYWAGIFTGVALFLIFILAQIVRPNRNWIWLPMVIFVVVMILKMTGEVNISRTELPVEISPNSQTSWQIAKDSAKDKIILGSGPASYSYDFSLHRPKDFNTNAFYNLRFTQASGLLFESLPTTGILGTIFLTLLLLSFLSVEMYLMYRNKEKNKLYSLGIFSAVVVLMVNGIIFRIEGTALIFGALLGALALATVLMESETEENYLNLSLKASPKFALALAFVFMVVSAGVAFLFVFLGKVFVADLNAGAAVRENQNNTEKAIEKMGSALRYFDRESQYYSQLGGYYMILANKEGMKDPASRDVVKIQNNLNYSVASARQAETLSPNDIGAVETLAQIYENAGLYISDSYSLAEKSYQRALELSPDYPNYLFKLGQLQVAAASVKSTESEKKPLVEKAKEYYQKSTEVKSNFAPGFNQLSLAQEALGDIDGAIESGIRAASLNSRDENYLITLGRLYQLRAKNDDLKNSQEILKLVTSANDSSIGGHFYLGLAYEKNKQKNEARTEYKKVAELLGSDSTETKKQVEKMIANLDAGIENTPENLGLIENKDQPVVQENDNNPEIPVNQNETENNTP